MNKLTKQTQEALKAIRAKVAHRREYLDILEMELMNTRQVLQEFSTLYRQRLGSLETELNRLEGILDEDVSARKGAPGSNGAGNAEGHKKNTEEPNQHHQKRKLHSTKNPDYERKIRELFRKLAKRFHPDLANEAEEKKQREAIMAKINQAYSARDLKALEELARDIATNMDGDSVGPDKEYLRLKVELRHLETMIFEVEHTIRELDLSPVMQMRSEAKSEDRAGRDLLGTMEFDLKLRIAELREHLLDLGLEL
jgi:hypothetical protein